MKRFVTEPAIRIALILVVVFSGLHLAGGSASLGVLSGTLRGSANEAMFGLVYALSWFAAIIVAPILALAGVSSVLLQMSRSTASPPSSPRKNESFNFSR